MAGQMLPDLSNLTARVLLKFHKRNAYIFLLSNNLYILVSGNRNQQAVPWPCHECHHQLQCGRQCPQQLG